MKQIMVKDLKENPFNLIGDEWMLITAGDSNKYNMMTASWGGVGVLWNKPVATAYIRPQRYTNEFVDNCEYFTLSFYGDKKDLHKVCGSKSGREVDKTKECGLHPIFDCNSVWFEEARLVLVCKKLYKQQLAPECFIDKEIDTKCYAEHDYHYAYIGEIEKVFVAD